MKTAGALIRKTWPKIRCIISKGKPLYQIDARRKGTGGRQIARASRREAEELAAQIADDFAKSGADGLAISTELRVYATTAEALLRPYGATILEAANHYKAYLDSLLTKENSRLVSELAEEWYQYKKKGSNRTIRPQTLEGIHKGRTFLQKHFADKRILEIAPHDIENVLNSLNVGLRHRFNIKSRASQFYNWCIKRGYCAQNPTTALEIDAPQRGSISILTPAKASKFMTLCESEAKYQTLTLYTALCLFAGLRPFECLALEWEDIHLEEKVIHIRKKITKVKESRNVKIESNLAEWLKAHTGERKGLITRQQNFWNLAKKYRADLGYSVNGVNEGADKYPQDVMRHSYASYWLAKYQDRAHLAEYMGNSLDMIKGHYKQVVSAAATLAFWEILPPAAAKALAKAKAEKAADEEAFDWETPALDAGEVIL